MSTSKNPNGYIPIVFTYGGNDLTYNEFLEQFYLTLPAGNGVQLGQKQYYGYGGSNQKTLTTGTSYPLTQTLSGITGLKATNATGAAHFDEALTYWASSQAASAGLNDYANVFLDHYTGGRIYLSNADLHKEAGGEPDPSDTTSRTYSSLYDFFEPYIAAAINTTDIPGNNADITDIDWFSFPITLKVWSYDFASDNGRLSESNSKQGGSGQAIYEALLQPKTPGQASNAYPCQQFPDTTVNTNSSNNMVASRLTGPTMAAAPASYYTDPANNPFPYHDFTDYLLYLSENAAALTLTGVFSGTGKSAIPDQKQQFNFTVDFSHIKSENNTYPSGKVTQISQDSYILFSGFTTTDDPTKTPLLGSKASPFTISVPWYKSSPDTSLKTVSQFNNAHDAVKEGWLTLSSTHNTGASGIYAPVEATALNAQGEALTPTTGQKVLLHLVYSLNTDPTGTSLDNLLTNGTVSVSSSGNLTCSANKTCVVQLPNHTGTNLTLLTNDKGDIYSATISDYQADPGVALGTSWTIPAGNSNLNNNVAITVTVKHAPELRNIFIQASAVWKTKPASLTIAASSNKFAAFSATLNSSAFTGSGQDSSWTTLSMPAGIYGANAGYTIAGLTGHNTLLNGDVPSLKNDLFGWVVADLLAALNAGLVGCPASWPVGNTKGTTIGGSPQDWFTSGNNPYTAGCWGEKAWQYVKFNKKPVTNFWNTWAWKLYKVPNVDAYNFAFTDRFESNILLDYNPPPANPTQSYPVLLEVIVGDSPFTGIQASQPWFDTGIQVKQGSTVAISRVSGLWTADPDTHNGQLYDADGCPNVIATQPGYPLTQVAMGALIGKIGEQGQPFLVGNALSQTPKDETGKLFLCINDDLQGLYGAGLKDNRGSIRVMIKSN